MAGRAYCLSSGRCARFLAAHHFDDPSLLENRKRRIPVSEVPVVCSRSCCVVPTHLSHSLSSIRHLDGSFVIRDLFVLKVLCALRSWVSYFDACWAFLCVVY